MHTKKRIPLGKKITNVDKILDEHGLHTVCQQARCPNLNECFNAGTATFLILGDKCTRNCRFCAISSEKPDAPDVNEPSKIADAVKKLNLKFVVITSVTRDDLPDGGASHFAYVIKEVRKNIPDTGIEVLVPDFKGDERAIKCVIQEKPEVFNHNIETVPRLYQSVRPQADYSQSLNVLKYAKTINPKIITKSGLMVGLGETFVELTKVFEDLVSTGCNILTIGQYYQATTKLLPVVKYLSDAEFAELKKLALQAGFDFAASGRYVRSSYKAKEAFESI